MYRIKRIIRRIKNLFRWLPVIWKDEQWDHYYIFQILKHKLIIMSDDIRKRNIHTVAKYDADRMMLCVRLIDKVQNEEYLMELVNNDNITQEMVDKADAKHNKARRLLFEILENYIERWWD
jgi:hypothetical protein